MRRSLLTLLAVLSPAALVSCESETTPTAPVDEALRLAHYAATIDVSGLWNWDRVELLSYPVWVADMFGMPQEGPITHIRCEGSGTMELVQTGASFSGSHDLTSITCETNGGIVFTPPPEFAPPSSAVENGVVKGLSIHFRESSGPLFGEYHGTISEAEDGVATALQITGRTIVPGHPKSPVPLDPPPGGTSKTISWVAVRS